MAASSSASLAAFVSQQARWGMAAVGLHSSGKWLSRARLQLGENNSFQFCCSLVLPPSMILHKTSPIQVIHLLAWNTAMLADWPGGMLCQWGNNQVRGFQSCLWRFRMMRWDQLLWTSSRKTAELPIACYQQSVYSFCSSISTVSREVISRDQSTGSGWCYLQALEYQCVTKNLQNTPRGFTSSTFKTKLVVPE